MKKFFLIIALTIFINVYSFAQKQQAADSMKIKADSVKPGKKIMGNMLMPTSPKGNDNNSMMRMNGAMNMPEDTAMGTMQMSSHGSGQMSDPFSRSLPMERHGSGTGWLPDASPMYGYMQHTKQWMFMLHGNIFIRYNKQDIFNKGNRGGQQFDAPNWFMFMGQHQVGSKGLFHFSSMFSLDPLTVGAGGYPLLFQSGEAYKGKPLVDRQHPHDLFSELSVSYSHAFSKKTDAFIYLGYPGEPALGPVAFMHRPAALYNPDAPLSHHWSDATHITFGVATIGVRLGNVKLDGSLFTGREPDANRYNFDAPKLDSWSGRLSYSPSRYWALQVSHGFLKSPEQLRPQEDVNRTTASAIFSKPLHKDSWVNISAVYGLNKIKEQNGENSFLLEDAWTMNKLTLYSKYEYVQKTSEELSLNESIYGHNTAFAVNAFTLGLSEDILHNQGARVALGGQFTYYSTDKKLNTLYGKHPTAGEVYIRIYPSLMKM